MSVSPSELQSPATVATRTSFPSFLLNAGFVIGLVLAIACLVSGAWYLFDYSREAQNSVKAIVKEHETPESVKIMAIHARNIQARLSLQACGVFVGMAFGFLGFSLFLLGINDTMDFDGTWNGVTGKATRLLPGVAVLAAATILVGICVTHTTSYTFPPLYPTKDEHNRSLDTSGAHPPETASERNGGGSGPLGKKFGKQ